MPVFGGRFFYPGFSAPPIELGVLLRVLFQGYSDELFMWGTRGGASKDRKSRRVLLEAVFRIMIFVTLITLNFVILL